MKENGSFNRLQIVGGGPGGIAPLVAEPELFATHVALINKDKNLGVGGLGDLRIKSNSKAEDFLEGAEQNPVLQPVLTNPAAK